jgi:hypothetical protein
MPGSRCMYIYDVVGECTMKDSCHFIHRSDEEKWNAAPFLARSSARDLIKLKEKNKGHRRSGSRSRSVNRSSSRSRAESVDGSRNKEPESEMVPKEEKAAPVQDSIHPFVCSEVEFANMRDADGVRFADACCVCGGGVPGTSRREAEAYLEQAQPSLLCADYDFDLTYYQSDPCLNYINVLVCLILLCSKISHLIQSLA